MARRTGFFFPALIALGCLAAVALARDGATVSVVGLGSSVGHVSENAALAAHSALSTSSHASATASTAAKATAQVEAKGKAQVEAKGKAEVEAKGKAEVEAKGKAEVEAKGKAEVEAKGKAGFDDEQDDEDEAADREDDRRDDDEEAEDQREADRDSEEDSDGDDSDGDDSDGDDSDGDDEDGDGDEDGEDDRDRDAEEEAHDEADAEENADDEDREGENVSEDDDNDAEDGEEGEKEEEDAEGTDEEEGDGEEADDDHDDDKDGEDGDGDGDDDHRDDEDKDAEREKEENVNDADEEGEDKDGDSSDDGEPKDKEEGDGETSDEDEKKKDGPSSSASSSKTAAASSGKSAKKKTYKSALSSGCQVCRMVVLNAVRRNATHLVEPCRGHSKSMFPACQAFMGENRDRVLKAVDPNVICLAMGSCTRDEASLATRADRERRMIAGVKNGKLKMESGTVVFSAESPIVSHMRDGSGPRETRKRIAYPTPFTFAPFVHVALSALDVQPYDDARVKVVAENVDRYGFDVKVTTWGKTKIDSVGVEWYAYGKAYASRGLIRSGRLHAANPTSFNKKIAFPVRFSKVPEVVVALSGIDALTGRAVRASVHATDVNPVSFTAQFRTWDGAVVRWASIAWIAFDPSATKTRAGLVQIAAAKDTQFKRFWVPPLGPRVFTKRINFAPLKKVCTGKATAQDKAAAAAAAKRKAAAASAAKAFAAAKGGASATVKAAEAKVKANEDAEASGEKKAASVFDKEDAREDAEEKDAARDEVKDEEHDEASQDKEGEPDLHRDGDAENPNAAPRGGDDHDEGGKGDVFSRDDAREEADAAHDLERGEEHQDLLFTDLLLSELVDGDGDGDGDDDGDHEESGDRDETPEDNDDHRGEADDAHGNDDVHDDGEEKDAPGNEGGHEGEDDEERDEDDVSRDGEGEGSADDEGEKEGGDGDDDKDKDGDDGDDDKDKDGGDDDDKDGGDGDDDKDGGDDDDKDGDDDDDKDGEDDGANEGDTPEGKATVENGRTCRMVRHTRGVKFTGPPAVRLELAKVNFAANVADQVQLKARDVSPTGFTLEVRTWGRSRMSELGVQWFAHTRPIEWDSRTAAEAEGQGATAAIANAAKGANGEKNPARSCHEIKQKDQAAKDGVYWVRVGGDAVQVFCDMAGGGWTRVVNVVGTSYFHANAEDAIEVQDLKDESAPSKLSDADINSIKTVGYFRFKCGGSYDSFVTNSDKIWTSKLSNSFTWLTSRDRNPDSFSCKASLDGAVFSEKLSTDPKCRKGYTMYAAGNEDVGKGCYVDGAGWGQSGSLWVM